MVGKFFLLEKKRGKQLFSYKSSVRGWHSLDQVSSAVRSELSSVKEQDSSICKPPGAGKLVLDPTLEVDSYVFTLVYTYNVCKGDTPTEKLVHGSGHAPSLSKSIGDGIPAA